MPRFEDIEEIEAPLDGAGLYIGIALSRFNEDIGDGLLSGCVAELNRLGVPNTNMRIVTVPGALELPLILQSMADSDEYDALIALGAVVRGETYHFEIVSNEMASGITRVQLDTGVPIANGVLTTEDDEQALERMHEKGQDCAQVAVEMCQLLKAIHQ